MSSTGGRAEAYVDTSAFIAFLDRSDTHHTLFRRLFGSATRLVTTTLVVAEGHAWFLERFDRVRALQFLALIDSLSPLRIVPVGRPEQAAGAEILRKFPDQDLTLTDAVGLHVSKTRRVASCWSTDRHLGLTGTSLAIEAS
jgi:predicted nucleic acid-binding protein